jgi:spermidine synthase
VQSASFISLWQSVSTLTKSRVVRLVWYFVFFVVSGFCGILYELVWLRLAMAQFGVTTPLVSIVLSMFMAGLGLGSWASGKLIRRVAGQSHFAPLRLYALAEFLIGMSAILVPLQLSAGHHLLQYISGTSGISSGAYYLVAATCLALTLVPWCACMGATIPLAMLAIRSDPHRQSGHSFSFLYLANLAGAVAGAIIPLFFIEAFGFHRTLRVGLVLNFLVALGAAVLSLRSSQVGVISRLDDSPPAPLHPAAQRNPLLLLLLTGLSTMGMEVVWIRLFTPSVGPMVYSFALILASYLFATFFGSRAYRAWSRKFSNEGRLAWVSLALFGALPLLAADSRLTLAASTRVFLGVMPFSCVIGFLTPMLVDRWSGGNPVRAGRAYALNVVGCIVGPLLAGFLLLPLLGERSSILVFLSPFVLLALLPDRNASFFSASRVAGYFVVSAALLIIFGARDFETQFPQRVVLRDSAATVIAAKTGVPSEKVLLVNGIAMTSLNSITKMMAHLTLASHDRPPRNTLVICFGMGTTFRSALTWGQPVTVVDLIPSVPKLFPYFHSDAKQVLASPNAHIVADDGRRYLERTSQTFDSIIVDPPPPVPAAGSSLLYSMEFYSVAKRRLAPDGIFQQWLPEGDIATQASVARALQNSFPYVRVFQYSGRPGWHYLASLQPIAVRSPVELAARMPARAAADFIEWGPATTPQDQFNLVLSHELTLEWFIARDLDAPPLRDDRPVNEYYFLRRQCLTCSPEVEFARLQLYRLFGRFLHPSTVSANR